jgi:hypothetical protein
VSHSCSKLPLRSKCSVLRGRNAAIVRFAQVGIFEISSDAQHLSLLAGVVIVMELGLELM